MQQGREPNFQQGGGGKIPPDRGPLRALRIARIIGAVFVGFILGIIGVTFFFSDLGNTETELSRIIVATIFFLIAGFLIGYVNPRLWPVAAVVGWASSLFGLVGVITVYVQLVTGAGGATSPDETTYIDFLQALSVLILPTLVALLGGFLGSLLGRRQYIRNFAVRRFWKKLEDKSGGRGRAGGGPWQPPDDQNRFPR